MSTNYTIVNTGKEFILDRKSGYDTGQPLAAVKLHLFKAYTARANARDQILSDFTEANFIGYLFQPLYPWSDAAYDATNFWFYTESALCDFISSDPASQTILGFYITDSAATVLIAFGVYAVAITLLQNQAIVEQIEWRELSEFNN